MRTRVVFFQNHHCGVTHAAKVSGGGPKNRRGYGILPHCPAAVHPLPGKYLLTQPVPIEPGDVKVSVQVKENTLTLAFGIRL